jgi:hypothetical protein
MLVEPEMVAIATGPSGFSSYGVLKRDEYSSDIQRSYVELCRIVHCCWLDFQARIDGGSVLCDHSDGEREHQVCEMQGLVEGPMIENEGECFSPLTVNATSVNVEVYYNKAVNYTLMVTFISFLQVLFLIRQMEHSNTQSVSCSSPFTL